MARILVIEDEQDLADLLAYNLGLEGHQVTLARTGAAALSKLREEIPEVVLLDLMLPDISGTEVTRMIRAEPTTRRVPIIIVTARAEESDRVRGLELGADDYVVKPFSVKELLLRVKAVLRRFEQPAGATLLKAPGIELDSERHEVKANGAVVALTALEFKLLRTFLERPGRVQTREALLSDVWGIDSDVTTRTVDTHLKRLREKLGAAGDAIQTVRGVGYKLGD
jgi:two-component system, OmpR family, phosphate regulon response regulator PhoB